MSPAARVRRRSCCGLTALHRHAIPGLRKSRPACLSLHPRANHAAPCSIVAVPIHPATPFNGYGARVTAGKTRRCAARRGNWFAGIAGKSCERAAFAPLPRRWLAPVRNCPHARGEFAWMLDTLPPSSARCALPAWSPDKRLRAGATVPGELCRVNSTWLCGRLA